MKATAIANANIAFAKYWGKRDERLILPQNSSISMTAEGLSARTTVEFSDRYKKDILVLNSMEIDSSSGDYKDYIGRFLEHVRSKYSCRLHTRIESITDFPAAAGLASSAAGFAALAAAVNEALSLKLDERDLSMLARMGSGSACRSVPGGFVEWKMGEKKDGSDSYAVQIAPASHWLDFRMLACVTSEEAKSIKSRAGMAQTVLTSPFYPCWLASVKKDLETIRKAITGLDLAILGSTAEHNCLKMHALMITTLPSIIYWNEATIRLMHAIREWRDGGLECYFTMDGGPQVKVICLAKDAEEITARCLKAGAIRVIATRPGEGARIISDHLF